MMGSRIRTKGWSAEAGERILALNGGRYGGGGGSRCKRVVEVGGISPSIARVQKGSRRGL